MTWLRFDLQAHRDEKLVVLRKRHGWEAIGMFWALAAFCFERHGYIDAAALPFFFEANDIPNGEQMFTTMLELRLFRKDGDRFTSDRVLREITFAEESRKRYSDAGKKGGQVTAKRLGTAKNPSDAAPSPQQRHGGATAPDHTIPYLPYLPDHSTVAGGSNSSYRDSSPEKKIEKRTSQQRRDEIEKWDDAQVEQLGKEFLTNSTTVSDEHYAKKTWDQRINLRHDNRLEFYRKCVLFNSYMRIKSEKSQAHARVLHGEIAGFVNDRGAMEKKLDDVEIAKRKAFAEEESGKHYVAEEF